MVSKRWKLSHLTAFSHAQEHLRVQTIHGAIGAPRSGFPAGRLHPWRPVHLMQGRGSGRSAAPDRALPAAGLPPAGAATDLPASAC